MNIDQLPIEMLMKIFSCLSRFDEVSLVNKLFYSLACKINDPNICLRLDSLFKLEWLPSVEKSTRQISKLDICLSIPNVATCPAMFSIITKFGASIKCLRITQTHLTPSEFLEILSLIPNVEHLVLERIELRDKKVFNNDNDSDNNLNLYQLKKLRFRGSNIVERDAFLAVFDRLPVGVLTELELSCFKLNAVVVLFKRQTNIVKLEMTSFVSKASRDSVDILDNLQLKSLVISSYGSHNLEMFLSKQTQLKSLKIPNADTKEDFLNFVANHISELETLSINIATAPSALCKANINKMKSLKYFSVKIDEDTATNQLESLAEYPYIGITSLFLHHNFLNVNLVQALAKSLTKLKALKFYCFVDCATIINAIMINFNFVEVLHIRGHVDGYHLLNDGDCFNPKLTELITPLPRYISRMHLNKLIADYPNLKKFQIDWDLIKSSKFRLVLNGFTKLESLTFIGSAARLTLDDLNYLMENKNNLKFISLGGLRIRFTAELKRHLSAAFGVIICNDYSTRIMAVDRLTMDRERRSKEKGLTSSAFI